MRPAILIIKIGFFNPAVGWIKKTDFVVSSAFGAGNNKIGFIMRIAEMRFSIKNKGRDASFIFLTFFIDERQ
jgi:hypothetical protein